MDLCHDLVEGRFRRKRIADQRDIDAVRHGPCGKQRKGLLGPHLPIAAMNEQQRRGVRRSLEEIDTVAFARAISEVEMIGVGRAKFT